MTFLVVCTLLWVSAQGQYVYETAAQTVEVQRFNETAAGSFDQVLGAFDADIGESGFGNAKPQRNNCKSQCCKYRAPEYSHVKMSLFSQIIILLPYLCFF